VTPPRTRGPYAKGRERRREILRVALEAYAEAGPRGVPLKEIAQRAGVTEAGLLHHFGSKEALLSAVLDARDALTTETFGETFDGDGLRRLVRHNASTPGLVRLFVDVVSAASAPDHPAHEDFRARYDRVLALCRTSFDAQLDALAGSGADGGTRAGAGVLEGTPGPEQDGAFDDAAWVSRMLVATMDGLQLQWLLDGEVDMADDIARLHAALLRLAAQTRAAREPS
jgi:AcrR family transcriptional regulator